MKKIIIIAVILLVSIAAIFNLSKIDKKEIKKETKNSLINNNVKEDKNNSESNNNDSENVEVVKNDDEDTNSMIDTSIKNSNVENKYSESKTNNTTSNNQNNSITQPSNNKNSTNSDQPIAPTTPEKELTEWEKLGISEDAYYNTPSDNDGELVFKGDISLCKNELNRLLNAYYDDGFDGGNTFTINGKYTYSYLGCGINVYIKGNSYTYSQIKSMGFN